MSKFVMSSRLAAELDCAFERNGWSAQEVKQLSSGKLLAGVHKMMFGQSEIKITQHIIDCDADPFVPGDWKVEEHQKSGQFKFDASQINLYLSAAQKNGCTGGNRLRKQLADKPVLNANVLDYLLAHPELIPEDWKGKYVFFWGTVYRYSDGRSLLVRCLCWDAGDRGRWSSFWIEGNWGDSSPAALRIS